MNSSGTIEDQIRQVDKIIKECEHSRKTLEQVSRRLDDLADEVKRYRDFLGHEKAHRDPTVYKTGNAERVTSHNESICGTLNNLTAQLSVEWAEKLRNIYNNLHSPPPSTPGSRSSDQSKLPKLSTSKPTFKMAHHRQSPIDIIADHVCHDGETCKPDTLNINYSPGDCCDVIVNEGGFRVNVKKNCNTYLNASHLPGNYQLAQFHAHWGCNASEGSEHLLNGKKLSGEVHFVFWNTNYSSFCEALEKDDGLAVIAVFLKEGKYNDNYHGLIDAVRKASGNSSPVAIPKDFHLEQLFPAPEHRDFVTYLGSLTTPPFNECVIWTIFTEPVEVSFGQLNVLRSIIPSNHRACQDRCGRIIKSSKVLDF
ncbi:unnamed protein product [Caenorhabditis bovis]|uniref:Alpha-carbonic anhydrase domain-containing protein n=1 Tax=Caenorhabditis bovis TaxID=2654633 RepID=A0A8S1ED08_9PELO|nr:unnamed protein product [Caenorhabditis bovis]